jgi:septal ring factor EnvC (AmiA/AmiB activator)
MRRARRNSLLALLLLTAQGGAVTAGFGAPAGDSATAGPGPDAPVVRRAAKAAGHAPRKTAAARGVFAADTAGPGGAGTDIEPAAAAADPGAPAPQIDSATQPPPVSQAAPAPNDGNPAPIQHEQAARRQVEDAERVRTLQIDTQRDATEQAAQAQADEQWLSAEQTEALERLKRAEAAVNEMTVHLLDLNRRRAEAQMRIDKQIEALHPLLPVIVRMSDYPVETLLGSGLPAEDAIRGILVMRTVARSAEAAARALAKDRETLDDATKAAAEVAPQLAAAEAARSYEADTLSRQLAATKERREAAEQAAADASRRAAAEAARANTLRSMLQILETQRRLEEARAREDALRADREDSTNEADAARLRQAALAHPTGTGTLALNAKPAGQVTPPVVGTLVRGWGDAENGEPATGQSWRTDPGAPVVAPCGGTVVFAEPFHGYGLLVIIDCGGGYHAVMSGMDQIAVVPGRAIGAGDPVGAMRAVSKAAATGAAPIETPTLYFELRKGGRPVDPAPWLRPSG